MNLDDLDVRPDGAQLLGELHAALTRYVVLPSPEAADATVLWIAATHAAPAWNCAPRLDVTSPVKRCGKSRLLDVIEATCHDPLLTVNISPAALVRSLGDDPPTLLLDEADTVFGPKVGDNHEDLRGILNAGHSRNRPYIRWDITRQAPEHCPTFALAALAGIGDLPDTITDRAIVVKMRRRAPGEIVARYRDRRDGAPLKRLGERLGAWVRAHADELRDAEPDMPVEDRAADTWEPLIAVADLAGADWPARARAAAVALTAEDDADTTLGARLLADLRDVFGDADRLHGETILGRLHKIDEAPWADYFGRPLNARDLAKLLRPYGVSAVDVKDGVTKRGYRREHLHDPWTRYLPPVRGDSATSATSATAQVTDGAPVAGSTSEVLPATSDPPLTCEVARVAEVADPPRTDGLCTVCGEPLDQVLTDAGLTDHGETAEPCRRCGERPGGNGGRSFCSPCIAEVNEENRQLGERIDKLRAEQEAELEHVRSWTWERLVPPVTGTRRRRETVTVQQHPTGWIANPGFDKADTCNSVFDLGADGYHAFHDPPGNPVIWKCQVRQRRTQGTVYYCDAHLPGEFRPPAEEPGQ